MKVLFICKATTEIGFGHLVRTLTVANTFHKLGRSDIEIKLKVIGEPTISNLLTESLVAYDIIPDEEYFQLIGNFDFIFLDLLEISERVFLNFRNSGSKLVSLSPVFNMLNKVDVLFHRSKYIGADERELPKLVYRGLEYTVIQNNCIRIDAGSYERNLNAENLPIAISMGGGDAANKTLKIITALRDCPVPVTFWVTLGEGYNHSYDQLIQEIKGHKTNEIILARTNKSMWHILNNCALAILLSGITSYEAVFAGLPSLVYYENDRQSRLVRELFEKKIAFDNGLFNEDNLSTLNKVIKEIYYNRRSLFDMHLNAKNLIKENGAINIYRKIVRLYENDSPS